MIPSLRRLGRRAVFQHDNDPKHTSKTTTAVLKKMRLKVMDWPSMSPDLNSIVHLWGILKWKVEEARSLNIHQLRDVVMEEWKRTPVATCEALVNSIPKRVKAVLENKNVRGVLTSVRYCIYIYIYIYIVEMTEQYIVSIYVTLDHKTSLKCQFFKIEIYRTSGSWINMLSNDVWFVFGWDTIYNIWLRYNYLKIWNLRVQKNLNIEKIAFLKLSKWSS